MPVLFNINPHLKAKLKPFYYWIGASTQSDWLFKKDTLRWMTESCYRRQFPPLYRFFSLYCALWILLGRQQIPLAKLLFNILKPLQRMIASQTSTLFKFPSLDGFFNLEDPRFLAVGKEVTQGDIYRILSHFINEGDTFVDVGANQGAFSLIASSLVGASGLIVSIEPQPLLAHNISKSLEYKKTCRFQVHQMAVGDHNGTIDLLIPRSYSGTAGIYPGHSGVERHTKLKVPIKRFDDAVNWNSFPGQVFVKLDIEGSELAFLKGAQKMMTTRKPVLFMEINPFTLCASKTDKDELVAVLMNYGYSHYYYDYASDKNYDIKDINTTGFHNVIIS
jgi:FkbM family methyltransferase